MDYRIENLRYIVFMIDSKIKQHDGKVFCNHSDAKEFVSDMIKDNYCDKAVIGMFLIDPMAKEMNIEFIESIGFPKDKKSVEQMDLFKPTTK